MRHDSGDFPWLAVARQESSHTGALPRWCMALSPMHLAGRDLSGSWPAPAGMIRPGQDSRSPITSFRLISSNANLDGLLNIGMPVFWNVRQV